MQLMVRRDRVLMYVKDIYLSVGAGLFSVTLLREYFYQKNGGAQG